MRQEVLESCPVVAFELAIPPQIEARVLPGPDEVCCLGHDLPATEQEKTSWVAVPCGRFSWRERRSRSGHAPTDGDRELASGHPGVALQDDVI